MHRPFVKQYFLLQETFCYGDVLLQETFCLGDVLFGDVLSRRRSVRRCFVCASNSGMFGSV
jgi:hypothetical protein